MLLPEGQDLTRPEPRITFTGNDEDEEGTGNDIGMRNKLC
jgi:hypothetical protein